MKLSEIIHKVEEWMEYFTYYFCINSIVPDTIYKYRISIDEYGPSGLDSSYFIYADENGNIFNDEGNLIDFAKDAYDYDQEILQWVNKFEEKWRS